MSWWPIDIIRICNQLPRVNVVSIARGETVFNSDLLRNQLLLTAWLINFAIYYRTGTICIREELPGRPKNDIGCISIWHHHSFLCFTNRFEFERVSTFFQLKDSYLIVLDGWKSIDAFKAEPDTIARFSICRCKHSEWLVSFDWNHLARAVIWRWNVVASLVQNPTIRDRALVRSKIDEEFFLTNEVDRLWRLQRIWEFEESFGFDISQQRRRTLKILDYFETVDRYLLF